MSASNVLSTATQTRRRAAIADPPGFLDAAGTRTGIASANAIA
jgi:hypothetical protein